MDASTWFTISIVGFSLAGVLLIVAIILFYKMNIMAIIGDLSGRTATRQIQEIREQNTISGKKRYKPSAFNIERGSLTEPVGAMPTRSSRLTGRGSTGQTVAPISPSAQGNTDQTAAPTSKTRSDTIQIGELVSNARDTAATEVLLTDTDVLFQTDGTMVLGQDTGTEVLADQYETEVLSDDYGTQVLPDAQGNGVLADNPGTEVLSDDFGTEVLNDDFGTTVLYPTGELEQEEHEANPAIEFKIVKDIKITHTNETI
ncbi:hypothetical protein HHO41_00210 [Bacillus sp. DNRA2]|uniref:hypothetical protein n=1 Tax=Bacillus sp. DNRA2 TaxID=2723053 RepID=UPI00145DAD75|nr:hypothetical protein [Bacillus sp. DNRA2]NMD68690.1 hypothetical protein [Bacillus sp. DNRA2]